MTDTTQHDISRPVGGLSEDERAANLRKRFAAETRFKYAGLACVLTAAGFLVLLLSTVIGNGLPAFRANSYTLELDLTKVDPSDPSKADYRGIVNDAIAAELPFVSGRRDRRTMRGLLSEGAAVLVQEEVQADPSLAGEKRVMRISVSDTADLYYKGLAAPLVSSSGTGALTPSGTEDEVTLTADSDAFAPFVAGARALLGEKAAVVERRANALQRSIDKLNADLEAARARAGDGSLEVDVRERAEQAVAALPGQIEQVTAQQTALRERAAALKTRAEAQGGNEKLSEDDPSLLIEVNGGFVKVTEASDSVATGKVLVPLSAVSADNGWKVDVIETPESERKISDTEVAWLEYLRRGDKVESHWNDIFFSRGASREPEMAGIWGAVVGSFLTMIVTLILSFPLGVAAAIYLEEFAPKNRLTEIIEVNINNLAAVPSIVFGLLGLGIFINGVSLGWFTLGGGFPRSAAITGGTVLALMTLPTIIIASRAALRAVPPSIREAAAGIGASRVQTVFHHVLPLAMPGMLTGTIIGMAQALGETAPLLMIGMVAFIVDVPGGFTDPATVLPVQIFMWADFPEIGFQQKTAAAIMVLLAFLVLMNAIAVLLRKKFERRW